MTCKKCKSNNVTVNFKQKIYTKHRGCLGWSLWLLLAVCTCGLILIIPALSNSKVKSKSKKIAICNNCGHTWKV